MIAKRQANLTEDAAVWMGQYDRPFLLRDKATAQNDPANQNRKTISTDYKVILLRISDAGDMAYEYGMAHNVWYRTDVSKQSEVDAPVLRVWIKVDGQWKIAAWFQRPNENTRWRKSDEPRPCTCGLSMLIGPRGTLRGVIGSTLSQSGAAVGSVRASQGCHDHC